MNQVLPFLSGRRRSVLSRAVARWRAGNYDAGLDALIDESGNGLHARLGSAVGADTNDPLRLRYQGRRTLYAPGSAGNYISTIDSAAVSPSTEIDLIRHIDLVSMPPAGFTGLMTRDDAGTSNNSYRWYIDSTNGYLNLGLSQTGGAHTDVNSGAVVPFTKGWVRATWRASDGRVQFFRCADQVAVPSGGEWTQLGTDKTIALASINDSGIALWIGCRAAGVQWNELGSIGYASIALTIGGSASASFDASKLTEPYASYTDPQGNVWTLNRSTSGRKLSVVDRDLLLLGTDDYLEVADSPLLNFGANDEFTVVLMQRTYGSLANQHRFSKRDGAGGAGYYLRAGSGTPTLAAVGISNGIGTLESTQANTPTSGDLQLLGIRRGGGLLSVIGNGGYSTVVESVGSLVNTLAFRIGRNGNTSTNNADMELVGGAIIRESLSAAELVRLKEEMLR